ncbi:MAG TPA: PorV/PorQ family protein, partial [Balneolaceae bacterium]|nr:PorV/PorQ family protein [Balneolaceae bacterium]
DGTAGGRSISPGTSFGVDIAAMYRSDRFASIFEGSDAFFSAGINISNMGRSLNYSEEGEKDPLPTVLRFGWAFTTELGAAGHHTLTFANDFSKLMVRADKKAGPVEALFTSWGSLERQTGQGTTVTLSTLQQFMVGVGLEYWYDNLFSLRSGYYYEDPHNGNREFLTLGAGVHYKFIGVNFSYIYAVEEQHPLANTTRFGLILDL